MTRELAGIPWRRPLAADELLRCVQWHRPETLSPLGPQEARAVLLWHGYCRGVWLCATVEALAGHQIPEKRPRGHTKNE